MPLGTAKLPANNLQAGPPAYSTTDFAASRSSPLVNTRKRSCTTRPALRSPIMHSQPSEPSLSCLPSAPPSAVTVVHHSHDTSANCQKQSAPSVALRRHLPSLVNHVNARASLDHALPSCPRTICQLPASVAPTAVAESHSLPLLQSLVTTRSLVNTRKRSCITRPCTQKLPANNLQAARQRSSNNRPQIFIRCQMLRQSLVNTRKRSCFTRPALPSCLRTICEFPASVTTTPVPKSLLAVRCFSHLS